MNAVRIATVKATGKRYVVQRIESWGDEKVFCWGECVSFRGLSAKFETGRAFLPGAVDVAEVDRTADLLASLVAQRIAGLRAAGHVVSMTRTGRTYTDHGTPAQIEARREATAKMMADFQPVLDIMRKARS